MSSSDAAGGYIAWVGFDETADWATTPIGNYVTVTSDGLAPAPDPDLEAAMRSWAAPVMVRKPAALCPCGAEPSEQFRPYCSDDCTPTHRGADTSRTGSLARWRPDLVSTADDAGLRLLAEVKAGDLTRQVFDRAGADTVHLRVHNDHRFVGADMPTATYLADEDAVARKWVALERELGNARSLRTEGGAMPYAAFASFSEYMSAVRQELEPAYRQALQDLLQRGSWTQLMDAIEAAGLTPEDFSSEESLTEAFQARAGNPARGPSADRYDLLAVHVVDACDQRRLTT